MLARPTVALFILWKALYSPQFGPANAVIDGFFDLIGFGDIAAPAWLISASNLLGLKVEQIGLSSEFFGLGARESIIIMGIWIAVGGNKSPKAIHGKEPQRLVRQPQTVLAVRNVRGGGPRRARFGDGPVLWQ